MRLSLTALAFLVSLAACSAEPLSACDEGPIQLTTGYSGSPASPCTRTDDGAFILDIVPEAEPINPSPWYAFTLSGPVGSEVKVTLNYTVAQHRYPPWFRVDEAGWQRVPDDQVRIHPERSQVELNLVLESRPMEIAAQPLYGLDRYQALEARWPGDWRTIGTSVEGRSIRALVLPPATDEAEWILMLGGQHPPEIPGAWAFEAFGDVMVERHQNNQLNAGLILIPLINPDGVDAGHWRLNAGLIDLNRDWVARSQPETSAVEALLEDLGLIHGDITLMVDFHATVADRLYLPQTNELSPEASTRLDRWLAAMEADGLFTLTEPRRTNPARRVSAKTAFTDEWQCIALTWEAGDTTPEATVRDIAQRGAALWE